MEIETSLPHLYLPEFSSLDEGGIANFDPLDHQPARVLVVIEKEDDDLFAEVVPPCREFGAALGCTKGFSTRGYAWRLCGIARADGDGEREPRPLHVLWLTDADTSGEHMPTVMSRHIEFIRSRHPEVPEI